MTTERIQFASASATRKRQEPLATEYAPYHTMPAFADGQAHYPKPGCNWINPHDSNSIDAQAWDRGLEFAMRLARYHHNQGE